MYAKIFKSMFDGTLRGKSDALLVFINLLANSDKEGFVDRHFNAIADETGLPLERVKEALQELESPDPESRSKDLEGRRLERISNDRAWGWRIVNYLYYRKLRDEEERREQNRRAQDKYRNKNKPESAEKPLLSSSKPKSAHADAEGDADADKEEGAIHSRPAAKLSEEDWRQSIASEPAYKHINVGAEFSKLLRWCEVNHKQPTRKRFINWLNRIEPPFKPVQASRTVRGAAPLVDRPTDLTDEQIAKNKAVIGPLVSDLAARLKP